MEEFIFNSTPVIFIYILQVLHPETGFCNEKVYKTFSLRPPDRQQTDISRLCAATIIIIIIIIKSRLWRLVALISRVPPRWRRKKSEANQL